MKFVLALCSTLCLLFIASAQEVSPSPAELACEKCLDSSLKGLPLCKGLSFNLASFTPGVSPEYDACFCSSMDGSWIENCKDDSLCGPATLLSKGAYTESLQKTGLKCNGTKLASTPATSKSNANSVTASLSPTASATSLGRKDALPSAWRIVGAVAVAVAARVGSSML